MDFFNSKDPIIACSSGGLTNTGIAVIRLSGFDNFDDIKKYISINPSKIKERYAHFCKIINNDVVIDEVILTYFKGPKSFNGENIIELSVHGNVFNIERIIKLFIDNCKFRMAHPGEFSYRALRNKKLNLTQVEGLDLFLNASNPLSFEQGQSLLNGSLQQKYEDLLFYFKKHKSAIELSIDFLDDVGEEESAKQVNESFNSLFNVVGSLKDKISNSSYSLIKPDIVLVGQPNSGKSTLFNLLLNDNRAIVSDIAGTTRDFISENIRINDNFFNLIDTAGLRETENVIEAEGIVRSFDVLEKGFFKILLINPFEFNKEFFNSIKSKKFDLVLFSHSDREGFKNKSEEVLSFLDINGPIEPIGFGPMGANKSGPIEPRISGPMGASLIGPIEPVKELIFELVNIKYLEVSRKEPILLDRHKDQINKIYLLLCKYKELLNQVDDISIISSEFNIVGHCISELIGIVSPDEVLGNIFENFCIGK